MSRIPVSRPPMEEASATSSRLQALWLIGSSTDLYQRLLRPATGQSRLIVQSDSETDDRLSPQTIDLVTGVIASRRLRVVILCGETSDVPAAEPDHLPGGNDAAGSGRQLLQNITSHLRRRQQAQARVAAQLHQLQAELCANCSLSGEALNLYALFYLKESDTFLIYNEKEQRFVPLFHAYAAL